MKKNKKINVTKWVGSRFERQRTNLKFRIKNLVIPSIKNYLQKIFLTGTYALLTLLILRLLGYSMTIMNYLSAYALYFFLEDVKVLILKIGVKK